MVYPRWMYSKISINDQPFTETHEDRCCEKRLSPLEVKQYFSTPGTQHKFISYLSEKTPPVPDLSTFLKLLVTLRGDFQSDARDDAFSRVLQVYTERKPYDLANYVRGVYTVHAHKVSLYILEDFLHDQGDRAYEFDVLFRLLFSDNYLSISPILLTQIYEIHVKICLGVIEGGVKFNPPSSYIKGTVLHPFDEVLVDMFKSTLTQLLGLAPKFESGEVPSEEGHQLRVARILELRQWEPRKPPPGNTVPWLVPFCVTTPDRGVEGVHPEALEVLERVIAPVVDKKFYCAQYALLERGDEGKRYVAVAPWMVMWLETFDTAFMALLQGVVGGEEVCGTSANQGSAISGSANREIGISGSANKESGISVSTNEKSAMSGSVNEKVLPTEGTLDEASNENAEALSSANQDPSISANEKSDLPAYRAHLEEVLCHPSAPHPLLDSPSAVRDFLLEPYLLIQLPWSSALLHQWLAAALLLATRAELDSLPLRLPLPSPLLPAATGLLTLVRDTKERLLLGVAVLCRQVNLYPEFDPSLPALLMDQSILPAVQGLQYILQNSPCTLPDTSAPSEDLSSVSPSVYTLHPDLEALFQRHHFHINYWLGEKLPPPFPAHELDLPTLVKELNSDTPRCEPKIVSADLTNPVNGLNSDTPRHEPEIVSTDLLTLVNELNLDTPRQEPQSISPELKTKVDSFSNPTLLSCLIRYTGLVLLQEHPTTPKSNVLPSHSKKSLDVVLALMKRTSRKWLDAKFPDITPLGVLAYEEPDGLVRTILPTLNIAEARKYLEPKLRSLIYGCSKQNFELVCEGKRPYPLQCMPQYLLTPTTGLYYRESLGRTDSRGQVNITVFFGAMHTTCQIQVFAREVHEWRLTGGTLEEYTGVLRMDPLVPEDSLRDYHSALKRKMEMLFAPTLYTAQVCNVRPEVGLLLDTLYRWPVLARAGPLRRLAVDSWSYLLGSYALILEGGVVQAMNLPKGYHPSTFRYPRDNPQLLLYRSMHVVGTYLKTMLLHTATDPCLKSLLSYELLVRMHEVLLESNVGLWAVLFKLETVPQILHFCSRVARKRDYVAELSAFVSDTQTLLSDVYVLACHLRTYLRCGGVLDDDLPEMKKFENICQYLSSEDEDLGKVAKLLGLKVPSTRHSQMRVNMSSLAKKYLHLTLPSRQRDSDTCLHTQVEQLTLNPTHRKKKVDKKPPPLTGRYCRGCGKKEVKGENFRVCGECVKVEYPDMNCFCGAKCEEKWWEVEHHAEHLEFELGLSIYSPDYPLKDRLNK